MERTRAMKRLNIVCISALLTLSVASNAFGWGAVSGPRGGAAYRGPMGGAAVRTPSGAAAARGPYGGPPLAAPMAEPRSAVRSTEVAPSIAAARCTARVSAMELRRAARLVLQPVPQRPRPTRPLATTRPTIAIRRPTTSRPPGKPRRARCGLLGDSGHLRSETHLGLLARMRLIEINVMVRTGLSMQRSRHAPS